MNMEQPFLELPLGDSGFTARSTLWDFEAVLAGVGSFVSNTIA